MSLIFELYKSRGKKACLEAYAGVQTCPLILRSTSEDILTATVFGILKNLNPHIWLKRFLAEALHRDFNGASFNSLRFEFWKRLRPPVNVSHKEGISEVDVVISFDSSVVLIEAKYLAPLSLFTTHGQNRNQVIRYIDVAINSYLSSSEAMIEIYLIVLTFIDEEPWLIKRYRKPENVCREVTRSNMFVDYERACAEICNRLGWISWKRLRLILEAAREDFDTATEHRFVDDLITYLNHKEKEGIQVLQERKGEAAQLEIEF